MAALNVRTLRTSSLLHQGLLQQIFQLSGTSLIQPHTPQRRFNSTSTATAPSPAVTETPSKPLSKVNGPLSTLPAPLNIPAREPNQSFFPSYLFQIGKAYAKFYKTGVYNIYSNFRASRSLQRLVSDKYSGSLSSAIYSGALSRADFQLLHRNWHDIKRVPIFGLVFIICGELTPLVVLAISNIVPWTCRIPRQVESDRKKLEERRSLSFRELATVPPSEGGVAGLGREQLMHINWSLGLSSNVWDYFDAALTDGRLRKKVQRRVDYLRMDDKLIRECGGVKEMEEEELRMACVDRGINVVGRSNADMRKALQEWLTSAEKVHIERLLLTR